MEEQERIASQAFDRNSDNIPGARKTRMSMPYGPFGLEAPRPQPLIREGEALAAMVVLSIVDPNWASVLEDRDVPRHTVGNAPKEFRQVERRVGVMTDAKQEYLPVEIVNTTDWAFGDVRRNREWVGGDPGSFWSGRGEGEAVIASQDTGLSPERIRNDPEARRRWSGHRVEGFVVIVRPRWHHQGTGGAECITEGVDQADWSSLDRPRGPERRVYEQHTTLVDAECAELIGHLGSGQLIPVGCGLQHSPPAVASPFSPPDGRSMR